MTRVCPALTPLSTLFFVRPTRSIRAISRLVSALVAELRMAMALVVVTALIPKRPAAMPNLCVIIIDY
jgi:hypothetical protein